MRSVLLCTILASSWFAYAGEPVPTPAQIAEWIKTLEADPSISEFSDLIRAGTPALPAVEQAEKVSKNPKSKLVIGRLAKVLRTLPVVQKVDAAIAKPGLSYELEVSVETQGRKMQATSRGMFHPDGKRFRIESTVPMADKIVRSVVQICDGKRVYRHHSILTDGKPTSQHAEYSDIAFMEKLEKTIKNEIQGEWERVKNEHFLYAVEEGKLDGQDVLILKAVSQVGWNMPSADVKHFGSVTVRKSDYLILRSEETSSLGTQDVHCKSAQFGQKMDDAKFIYTPVPGVVPIDADAQMKKLMERGEGEKK